MCPSVGFPSRKCTSILKTAHIFIRTKTIPCFTQNCQKGVQNRFCESTKVMCITELIVFASKHMYTKCVQNLMEWVHFFMRLLGIVSGFLELATGTTAAAAVFVCSASSANASSNSLRFPLCLGVGRLSPIKKQLKHLGSYVPKTSTTASCKALPGFSIFLVKLPFLPHWEHVARKF